MAGERPKRQNLFIGKWIPQDRVAIMKWAKRRLEEYKVKHAEQYAKLVALFPDTHSVDEEIQVFARNVSKIAPATLFLPVVNDLAEAMGNEPDVAMVMCTMFNSDSEMNARDFLFWLNITIRQAPRFIEDENIQIPVPVGALLTCAMGTPGGFAGFIMDRINELFKAILDDYGMYLTTYASTAVLTEDPDFVGGWFTPAALNEMPNFAEIFVCNPDDPRGHWGFNSFDEFFTRNLVEGPAGRRPTASPDNDLVVVNACENAPYQVAYSVQRHDAFWIKSQPYSLQYILKGAEEYVERFIGGTVYQGFLSPHTYHRFHAPVSGEVKVAKVVPGTYFSQPYYTDSQANYIASQPYLAHMATRGVIIIDTKNPSIGHVAFIPIGMVDVSTVDLSPITQRNTNQVVKGDGIGCFHFGGSSHLLIFERGVELAFDLQGIVPDPNGNDFLDVRSKLATVISKRIPLRKD
eukprot:TCONS_00073713-protein